MRSTRSCAHNTQRRPAQCHVLFGDVDIEAEYEDGDDYDERHEDTIPEGSEEEGDDMTPAFNVIPASTEGHSDEGRPGY